MLKPIERFSIPSTGSYLYGVQSSEIDSFWFEVLPLVKSALEYDDRYTSHSIYQSLKSRDMQLWLSLNKGIEACCITKILPYPNKTVCWVVLVAGEAMENWIKFMTEIGQWAKEQGCQCIEAAGRFGWVKVTGWEKTAVIIRRQL